MFNWKERLQSKETAAKAAENQTVDAMPHANLSIPKVNRIKQFFEDRQYDDVPFKLEGPANMRAVQEVLRKEQDDEYMHRDENMKTFNIINETNNQHPYDAYFQRKRPDEQSDS
jgi:hypothetical protein